MCLEPDYHQTWWEMWDVEWTPQLCSPRFPKLHTLCQFLRGLGRDLADLLHRKLWGKS
jgi:hypothetical protein